MKGSIRSNLLYIIGIGIALYVVLGCIMNIPLLAGTHLQTDLGYIAFGVYCCIFGWPAFIIGTIGCMVESLLISGWIPIGWMAGNIFIGVVCGLVYTKSSNKITHGIATIISVFIGVGLIKTVIECALYGIPFIVKLPKNAIAFIADSIPMVIGLFAGYRLDKISFIKDMK